MALNLWLGLTCNCSQRRLQESLGLRDVRQACNVILPSPGIGGCTVCNQSITDNVLRASCNLLFAMSAVTTARPHLSPKKCRRFIVSLLVMLGGPEEAGARRLRELFA